MVIGHCLDHIRFSGCTRGHGNLLAQNIWVNNNLRLSRWSSKKYLQPESSSTDIHFLVLLPTNHVHVCLPPPPPLPKGETFKRNLVKMILLAMEPPRNPQTLGCLEGWSYLWANQTSVSGTVRTRSRQGRDWQHHGIRPRIQLYGGGGGRGQTVYRNVDTHTCIHSQKLFHTFCFHSSLNTTLAIFQTFTLLKPHKETCLHSVMSLPIQSTLT